MIGIINTNSPFYNFLIKPKFRVWRHLCLILAGAFISINYVMPREELENINLPGTFIFFLYILFGFFIVIYFNIYFLIPQYLIKKKYIPYLTWLLASVAALLVAQYIIERHFDKILDAVPLTTYNSENPFIFFVDIFSNYFSTTMAFIGCSITVLLKQWIIYNEKAGKLERQHIQTEVDRLKEQANPDFLFSTLRAIASLEESDPQKASVMTIKLSHLLRYQLYDCSRNEVFLSSEIQYLTNYLNLKQLSQNNILFKISSAGDFLHAVVPPLLFIPFIQNIVNKINNKDIDTHIELNFYADDERIQFTCSSDNYTYTQADDFSKIEQRLNLLFGKEYKLETLPLTTPGKYFINLQVLF